MMRIQSKEMQSRQEYAFCSSAGENGFFALDIESIVQRTSSYGLDTKPALETRPERANSISFSTIGMVDSVEEIAKGTAISRN